MSASIASLERELGVELFHRTGKSVELTNAGRAFLGAARRVIAAADAATIAARTADYPPDDTLTVSVAGHAAEHLHLACVVDEFHAECSDVELQIDHAEAPAFDGILNGTVDIALGPGRCPCGVTSIVLTRCPIGGCELAASFLGPEPRKAAARAFLRLLRSRDYVGADGSRVGR